MTDREKVIKGLGEILRYCHEMYSGCDNDGQYKLACMNQAAKDALALLKAQEPVTVIPAIKKNDELLAEGICPICGAKLDYYLNGQFCGCCGRRLKWE